MKSFFRHFRFGAFAVALLCVGLGAALLLWPDLSQQVFCYAFGIVLALTGLFQIASYLVGSQKGLLSKLMFVGGVISCVAGVWILFAPGKVLTLTIIVMGVVLLYHGIMDVKYGFDIKNTNGKAGPAIIFGLLTCAVGVLLLVDPFGENIQLLFMISGFGFLFDGVTDLYAVTAVAASGRRYDKAQAALAAAEATAALPVEEPPAALESGTVEAAPAPEETVEEAPAAAESAEAAPAAEDQAE